MVRNKIKVGTNQPGFNVVCRVCGRPVATGGHLEAVGTAEHQCSPRPIRMHKISMCGAAPTS